jgi:glycerate-2-kinase
VILAAGSDGRDGGGASGGCVDAAQAARLDPETATAALERFASGPALANLGARLAEGPAATNLTDVYAAIRIH